MENYSFYLFSKLFDAFIGHKYEYDLMYKDIRNLYFLFKASSYLDSYQNEYEAMCMFYLDNKDYIKNQEYLLDIAQLNN